MAKEVVRRRETSLWRPVSLLHDEMERLFDSFFRDLEMPLMPAQRVGFFTPSMDVEETDKEFKISAELPGLDEKDVRIYLARGDLVIEGEKKQERKEERHGYFQTERSYGTFRRTIPLPEEVEQDKIAAEFHKGVLTVSLPKNPRLQAERKSIPIKSD